MKRKPAICRTKAETRYRLSNQEGREAAQEGSKETACHLGTSNLQGKIDADASANKFPLFKITRLYTINFVLLSYTSHKFSIRIALKVHIFHFYNVILTLCGRTLFQVRFSLGRKNFVEESDITY